jgi:hypothetical protein
MNSSVVAQFFANYRLIQDNGYDVFVREQSKLLSPGIVTISHDPRGTLEYQGIDAYFTSLREWFEHYRTDPNLRAEIVEETPTHALAQLYGDVRLVKPIDGKTVSKEGEHEWTEEFELADGLITQLVVRLTLHSS